MSSRLITESCLCLRIVRLQTESEFNQRPDQEVAKTEPRHNAEPVQAPAQVTHTHLHICQVVQFDYVLI